MKSKFSADRWLALFFFFIAIAITFLWIPSDTGTGFVEKVRRNYLIGDALGPTVAGAVIAIGALLAWINPLEDKTLDRRNLYWIASLLGLFAISLLLMRFTGPILTFGFEGGYRPLRATPPWNYLGFLVGGTMMVGTLTGLTKKQFSVRDFVFGFIASLGIALMYDLPFDDLLLPPNGDV